MGNEGLKPCPLCSGDDAFVERSDLSSCHVVCNDCGCRGPSCCNENDDDVAAEDAGMEPGENASRRAWNTRPDILSSGKDREAIALIVDPEAWTDVSRNWGEWPKRREASLAKAELILALPNSDGNPK